MQAENYLRIHGIITKKSGKELPSGNSEILRDRIIPGVLTFQNTPRYDLYDIHKNQQIIPEKKINDISTSINTSFGCPYTCDFCCTPVMFGPKLITKPLEAVAREALMIKERISFTQTSTDSYIFIRDENFTLQQDYPERLALIKNIGARIYLFASANTLTEEVVDVLAKNNVYMVCLGLEDPEVDYKKIKH